MTRKTVWVVEKSIFLTEKHDWYSLSNQNVYGKFAYISKVSHSSLIETFCETFGIWSLMFSRWSRTDFWLCAWNNDNITTAVGSFTVDENGFQVSLTWLPNPLHGFLNRFAAMFVPPDVDAQNAICFVEATDETVLCFSDNQRIAAMRKKRRKKLLGNTVIAAITVWKRSKKYKIFCACNKPHWKMDKVCHYIEKLVKILENVLMIKIATLTRRYSVPCQNVFSCGSVYTEFKYLQLQSILKEHT